MHNNTPSTIGSGIVLIWPVQALVAQRSYVIMYPNATGPCSYYTAFSHGEYTYGLMGHCDGKLKEDEKTQAGFTDAPAWYAGATQRAMKPYNPSLGHTRMILVNRNHPSGQKFEQCTCVFTLLGKKKWPGMWLCKWIVCCGLIVVRLNGHVSWEKNNWKTGDQKMGKEVCG